ncbi:MAG: hypothetical protein ACE5K4_01280 [Candidatus Hydrothermarchaeota archaeon]
MLDEGGQTALEVLILLAMGLAIVAIVYDLTSRMLIHSGNKVVSTIEAVRNSTIGHG